MKVRREGFIVDYDKDGNVIGIEILDVSEYLSPDELATVKFDISRALPIDKQHVISWQP